MIKTSTILRKDTVARLKRFCRTNKLLKIAEPNANLGLQVFVAGAAIDREYLEKYLSERGKVECSTNNKPFGHVFWTSTLKDKQSAWLQWCSYEMPQWIGEQVAIIRPGGKVFHIRGINDYYELYEKYPFKDNSSDLARYFEEKRNLDWAQIAKDWDGIHMTEEGVYGTREFTYGWDVESTAWLNPTVLTIERIVDVKRECSIREEDDEEDDYYSYGGEYTLEAKK